MGDRMLHIRVTTPEKVILDTVSSAVELPGTLGRFTVLYNHASLISSLTCGNIVWQEEGLRRNLHIKAGFVSVDSNSIEVFAEQ